MNLAVFESKTKWLILTYRCKDWLFPTETPYKASILRPWWFLGSICGWWCCCCVSLDSVQRQSDHRLSDFWSVSSRSEISCFKSVSMSWFPTCNGAVGYAEDWWRSSRIFIDVYFRSDSLQYFSFMFLFPSSIMI